MGKVKYLLCVYWPVRMGTVSDTFKQHNDRWETIRIVMADKDLKEQDVIKQCLPKAVVLICFFHTLRTFCREVTCEKLGISSGQRTSV